MIRAFNIKFVLFITMVAVTAGGAYFAWHKTKELSQTINSVEERLSSQRSDLNRQHFALLNSMLKMQQEETGRDIRALLSYGQLGDLVNNASLNDYNRLRLELWLKATSSNLELTQVVVFAPNGDVVAGVSEKVFVGASGLVDGKRVAESYSELVDMALKSRGTEFFDLLPDDGYDNLNLSFAYVLPIKDRSQRIVGAFGVSTKVDRGKLFSNYYQLLGQKAPLPFINLQSEQATPNPLIFQPLLNHNREQIALVGIRQEGKNPNPLLGIVVLVEQVELLSIGTLIALAILVGFFFFTYLADRQWRIRATKEQTHFAQDARRIFDHTARTSWEQFTGYKAPSRGEEKNRPPMTLVVRKSQRSQPPAPEPRQELFDLPVRYVPPRPPITEPKQQVTFRNVAEEPRERFETKRFETEEPQETPRRKSSLLFEF